MLIGAHVSVSGGYSKALEYAQSVEAECIQIFAKSPRQWRGPVPDSDAAAQFREARASVGGVPLFTHTAYLINLAAADDIMWEKSVLALADELTRANILGVDGVATHLGSNPSGDIGLTASRIASGIVAAFDQCGDCSARLLMENTAGAGATFGGTPEELGAVVRASGLTAEVLGVCIDTCHAHAAGLDVSGNRGWEDLLDSMDRECGEGRVGLIHANDCKFGRGEHKDRHEWIGDGFIGSAGFEAMLNQERLSDICAVLEMPGEVPEKDRENIARLKTLRTQGQS
ncbi:MAG: deoxyribonuclease IV [Actinomycetota bacterium]|jgi:deoxyribonuclease-4|nr:deoxyribonuclease IV [Actinomycetota bacterium]